MATTTSFQEGAPTRQNFYEVQTQDGRTLIAEWREYSKKQGKRWWEHTSPEPTVAKTPTPLEGVIAYRQAAKHAIDKALARELTLAEKVQNSYQGYLSTRSLYPTKPWAIPEERRLHIGDKVEIGALKDAEVVALHEDGQAVTVRYHNQRSEYGRVVDRGYAFGTWFWMDALKLADMQPTQLAGDTSVLDLSYSNTHLDSVIHRVVRCEVNDAPDYQRGYVWTPEDKARYLESLFEGRDLGRFIFVRNPYPQADELFDGKQRLSTILDLISSRLPYKGVYWHQMSPRDRQLVESRTVQCAELHRESLSRANMLRIFLAVNAAGVPQTEAHLQHVRDLLAAEEANPS